MPGHAAQANASLSKKWSMDDTLSPPYTLEPVEEVELDSGSDDSPSSDRASSTGMRRKNSLTSLEMGEGKVMIMQSRRRISLALIFFFFFKFN